MVEKHVTLIPYGGLANRMKAIESLLHLLGDAEAEGMFVWFRDKGLNCRFISGEQTTQERLRRVPQRFIYKKYI